MKRIISSLWVAIFVITTLSFGAATSVSAAVPATCTISDLGRLPGGPNTHRIVFSATDLPTTQSYNVSLDWRNHQNIRTQDISLDGGSNGSYDSGDINIALTPPPTNQSDVLSMIIKNKVTEKTECTFSLIVAPASEEEVGAGLPASGTSSQQSGCQTGQVNTALGCVPTDPGGLAQVVLTLALGIAGGLAILFIIIGGFKVATSSGDPDQLEEGRNTITSALAGLIFILLAVVILVIIGVDILGIPALSRSGSGVGLPNLR